MNQLTITSPSTDPIAPTRQERPRAARTDDGRSFDDALADAERLDRTPQQPISGRDRHRPRPAGHAIERTREPETVDEDVTATATGIASAASSRPTDDSSPTEAAATDEPTVAADVVPHVPGPASPAPTPIPTSTVPAAVDGQPGAPQQLPATAATVPVAASTPPLAPDTDAAVAEAMSRAEISVLDEPAAVTPPATTGGDVATAVAATGADTTTGAAPRGPQRADHAATPTDGTTAGDAAAGASAAPAPATVAGSPPVSARRQEPTTSEGGSFADVVRGGAQQPTATGSRDETPADAPAPTPAASTPGGDTRPAAARLAGRHRLALDLGTEGLGPLRMEALADGATLHLNLLAADRATTEALNARLPELRHDLESAGVRLGQLDVGTQQRDGADRHDERPTPTAAQAPRSARPRPAPTGPSRPRRLAVADGFDLRL